MIELISLLIMKMNQPEVKGIDGKIIFYLGEGNMVHPLFQNYYTTYGSKNKNQLDLYHFYTKIDSVFQINLHKNQLDL